MATTEEGEKEGQEKKGRERRETKKWGGEKKRDVRSFFVQKN